MVAACIGCSKPTESFTPAAEALCFSLTDDLTRAPAGAKEAWALGDRLAIFEDGNPNSKCYKISDLTTLTLTPTDQDNYFEASASDKVYTAYYPYKADYSSSDYLAGTLNEDLLTASVTVVSGSLSNDNRAVTFGSFIHLNCYFNFLFTAGNEYSSEGLTDLYLVLRNGATTLWDYTLTASEVSSASYARYLIAPAYASALTLYMAANNDTDAFTYTFDAEDYKGGSEYTINLTVGNE